MERIRDRTVSASRRRGSRWQAALPTVLAGVLGTSLLIGCAAETVPEDTAAKQTNVTLVLDYLMDGNKAPLVLGKDKGFFKERGINLTIEEGSGSSDTVKFVGNGRFDFGLASAVETAVGAAEGIPVLMVGNHQPKGQHVIFVRQGSGIESIKDLEGRSVATGLTSESEPLLEPTLRAAGVDVSKVEIARVDINVVDQTFLQGKYDALANPYEAVLSMKEAEPDANFRAFWYSDYGLATMNQGLIVHRDLVERNPDLVRRMVAAYAASYRYAANHKEELVQVVTREYPSTSEEKLLAEFEVATALVGTENTADKPFGYMAEKDWNSTAKAMTVGKLLDSGTDVHEFYTNRFIGDWPALKPVPIRQQ